MSVEGDLPRRTVLAAVDDSPAAPGVMSVATTLAQLLLVGTEAVHIIDHGDGTARAAAELAGMAYTELRGSKVDAISERAARGDVVALVMGAPVVPLPAESAGHVGLELMARLTVPVIVVPRSADPDRQLRRMLVPLDGTRVTSDALSGAIELAVDADLEVIALHVHEPPRVPLFTEQPQHEWRSWAGEFLGRFTTRPRDVRLEVRVGKPTEHLLAVAAQHEADMIVLGWSQSLEEGRAAVVREAIERGRVPVMLVPLQSRPAPSAPERSSPKGIP